MYTASTLRFVKSVFSINHTCDSCAQDLDFPSKEAKFTCKSWWRSFKFSLAFVWLNLISLNSTHKLKCLPLFLKCHSSRLDCCTKQNVQICGTLHDCVVFPVFCFCLTKLTSDVKFTHMEQVCLENRSEIGWLREWLDRSTVGGRALEKTRCLRTRQRPYYFSDLVVQGGVFPLC